MAANDEPEVKDVDRVEITPAGDDDETIEPEEPGQDSSPAETGDEPEGDEPEGENRPDALAQRQVTTPPASTVPAGTEELARIEGETPREYALRLELHKTRGKLRKERTEDLLGGTAAPAPKQAAKKEMSPERKAVLDKYKPEEIAALREVIPALAEEMGFVRQDELAGATFAEQSQAQLDTFLDKHPEYTPEKDPDGTLWDAFKAEYGLYKQPSNPKDFAKIFERVHRDVFGIRPKGPLKTVTAQQERARVASHAGASSTPAAPRATRAAAPTGLRTDMLKGFTDEEKADLLSDE